MPRGKRKKQETKNIDIQVVLLVVISIILAILIYAKSGSIGENLSPFLRRTHWLGKIHFATSAQC